MTTGGPASNGRILVTSDEIAGFRIVIRAARNLAQMIFFSLWLCGWLVGEIFVGSLLSGAIEADKAHDNSFFMILWFVLWTFGGATVMLSIAWSLAGREVIVIGEEFLTVRQQLGPFDRSKHDLLSAIRNLRYSPVAYNPCSSRRMRSSSLQTFGPPVGVVAFDVGDRTRRFGDRLEESEARRLIATIKQRFMIPDDVDEPLPVSS